MLALFILLPLMLLALSAWPWLSSSNKMMKALLLSFGLGTLAFLMGYMWGCLEPLLA